MEELKKENQEKNKASNEFEKIFYEINEARKKYQEKLKDIF